MILLAVVGIAGIALLAGCGGDDAPRSTATGGGGSGGCGPGELVLEDGCLVAGMQESGCAAGEVTLEGGGCRAAGLPPEQCSTADEGGCVPILPPDLCDNGLMAVPGETSCREIAPCGAAPWGDIPVDATTQYVDGSFAAGSSDGSAAKPWTTIQDGITAAAPGAIVAVAAGSYVEDATISGKAVTLRGRCPAMVEIMGSSGGIGAVFVKQGAGSSEIRDLAIRGGAAGLVLSGSQGVVADRLWIHDTGKAGVIVQDTFGETELSITGSLVEAGTESGVFVGGSTVSIEASAIRETRPRTDELFGRGIAIQNDSDTGRRANVAVHACLVERNHDIGVYVQGSDAAIDATVVRDTEPRASDGTFGQGINVRDAPATGDRSIVTVGSCVVAGNHGTGMFASGSDATVEGSAIRDTLPEPASQAFGWGVDVEASATGARAVVTLRSSILFRNQAVGMFVVGSDATIEGSVVRDTQPQASDQGYGLGIQVQIDKPTMQRGMAVIRSSLIERNFDAGLFVAAADATVEATIVRGTMPRVSDGAFGDGVAVAMQIGPASAAVTGSRIEGNARAGIASFGASAAVGSTVLECNTIHLDSEIFVEAAPSFEDRGGNVCGCAGAESVCQALSSNLAPPDALPPVR